MFYRNEKGNILIGTWKAAQQFSLMPNWIFLVVCGVAPSNRLIVRLQCAVKLFLLCIIWMFWWEWCNFLYVICQWISFNADTLLERFPNYTHNIAQKTLDEKLLIWLKSMNKEKLLSWRRHLINLSSALLSISNVFIHSTFIFPPTLYIRCSELSSS